MKRSLLAFVERHFCLCWVTNRDWTYRVPLWPGRDSAGWLAHSIGSVAYRIESAVLLACWPEDEA